MRSLEFKDFDDYASAVRHADVRMMCDHIEERRWRLANWDLPGISLQVSREGGGNLCEGTHRSNGSVLFLPLTRAEVNSANGEPLDEQSLVVVDPGGEFRITARRREHAWASIMLPSATEAATSGISRSASGCRVLRPAKNHHRQLGDLVRRIASSAQSPDILPDPSRHSAASQLLKAALACVSGEESVGGPEVGRPRLNRHEIILRCLACIEDHGDDPISTETLAGAASVSERTLRASFHDYFGLSPVEYLRVRSLHRVRQALRRASAENTTVTEILAAHGIWEFGRFACRYRSQFGESPSGTLRRRPD